MRTDLLEKTASPSLTSHCLISRHTDGDTSSSRAQYALLLHNAYRGRTRPVPGSYVSSLALGRGVGADVSQNLYRQSAASR